MGKYKNKTYPLRIDGTIMNKLEIISNNNSRSKNKEIEFALKRYVDVYEAQHGEIKIEEQ